MTHQAQSKSEVHVFHVAEQVAVEPTDTTDRIEPIQRRGGARTEHVAIHEPCPIERLPVAAAPGGATDVVSIAESVDLRRCVGSQQARSPRRVTVAPARRVQQLREPVRCRERVGIQQRHVFDLEARTQIERLIVGGSESDVRDVGDVSEPGELRLCVAQRFIGTRVVHDDHMIGTVRLRFDRAQASTQISRAVEIHDDDGN